MTALKNILLFTLLVVTDLITKYLAVNILPRGGWWLTADYGLTLTTNQGMAFGWWSGGGTILPMVLIALLFIIWLYFYRSHFQYRSKVIMILILAGGIGNLIDRLTDGTITDFMVLGPWPTSFNLADIFITMGVVWLLMEQLKKVKAQN